MLRKTLFTLLFLTAAAAALSQTGGDRSYETLKRDAERYYAEKSFSRAHALYEEASKLPLQGFEKQWVELRLADTAWRADAASPDPDGTKREEARKTLERFAAGSPPDRITAEANESLGDFFGTHPSYRNPSAAQQPYALALDFWAGSEDLEVARKRYLSIVWRMSEGQSWGVPQEVLVNAVKLAVTPEERARARFLLASHLTQRDRASMERAFELLEEVIALGPKTEWYDDALYTLAESLTRWSDARASDPTFEPRYERALVLYRRLLAEVPAANTPFHDDAKRAIVRLTEPSVDVGVSQTFLPDAEQTTLLTWRNVGRIDLTLHAVDLTRDTRPDQGSNWNEWITTANAEVVRRWSHDTNDAGDHRPGRETLTLNPRLAPGAYVLGAKAGSASASTLVLVTDAHILVHSGYNRMTVFLSDVETGEPIPSARVRVSPFGRNGEDVIAQTNADGLAEVAMREGGSVFITAAAGTSRQAWHQTWSPGRYSDGRDRWNIYAFTDRPAYRPNETVQWKIIARVRKDEVLQTPSGETLAYEITSPRGDKVASGTARLNAFGSYWGELALTPSMPLGEYAITFRTGEHHVAGAQLFRLEEYKLPEFAVTVSTPEGTRYRLGDTIEATIDATYYFGGPVANAEVEAVVYAQPFRRYWYPWREYAWYWQDSFMPHHESVMTRETLRTDAGGRAIIRITSPRDGTDMTYRIEARVVDASRREVRGEGSVRVTRQRYSVMAQPEHFIHRPGDSVSVRFRALDANDRPVQTTGTVEVIRRRWRERAYVDEDILTTKLTTDAEGEATLKFTPRTAGYYAVRWESTDGDSKSERDLVTAETTIWVADRSTTDIGYYHGGDVDLIIDKESVRVGEPAPVIVVTPESGRWVLLTTSAGTILDSQVVKLDGTARLVQIPVDARHVPNFFVTASSVVDLRIATDSAEIVVPPVEHFLTVDVKSDREEFEPRQEGTLTITTRNAEGRPVPAEVAVSVSDEAVTAIARDPAGDPRQFFFGEKRQQMVQVSGSVQSQRYVKKEEKSPREIAEERRDMEADKLQARGRLGRSVAESITVSDSAAARQEGAMAPPPPAAPAPVTGSMKKDAAANVATMEVEVRSDFRSTALWKPDVVTDANGAATVTVKFPEALTTWRATARAATSGSAFGMASSTARTNLPLLVRLQGPRFFVEGDRAVISAVINNNTGEAMEVDPVLEAEGGVTVSGGQAAVSVPANGEARVDWTLAAERAGEVKLRVTARGVRHGDAMEKTFVVYEHGIDKLIARSGKLRGDEAVIRLDLPRERRATDLTVQVTPTLAAAMLDALPYLIEFPYGCTEQTMSRFLPAAIVARTLEKLGLDPSSRVPKSRLDAVTAAGMARLYDMQHGDGGWGWWKEGDSDDFMTAYVIWGFAIAREGGLPVRTAAVDRAASWLAQRLVETRNQFNEQAWMLHALSAWRNKPSSAERRAYDAVWTNRERLSAYSRALFALTAHRYGESEHARVLVRNLEDGVKIDRTPDQSILLKGETTAETMATAHWGADRFWWRWHDGPVETTAFVLQALVTIEPDHKLVEPAMNWLVKNRRGAQWSNTRDTAISLLALNDYLQRSGELRGDIAYDVTVNGRVVATKTVTAADVLRTPSRFTVDAALIGDTTQEVRIRRTRGTGPLYFSAEARFVSLEEPVKAAGNEIFVRREYFRLAPRATLLKGVRYERVPLRDGESIISGERVEVVVTVDAKNDYDYLMFEDLKPGGFEAVELQSGQSLFAINPATKASAYVYQELRDRKVAMFIDHLQQGVSEIRYTLRAETPGSFHALPLLGQAMYVPDIRANGDEVRVVVEERR